MDLLPLRPPPPPLDDNVDGHRDVHIHKPSRTAPFLLPWVLYTIPPNGSRRRMVETNGAVGAHPIFPRSFTRGALYTTQNLTLSQPQNANRQTIPQPRYVPNTILETPNGRAPSVRSVLVKNCLICTPFVARIRRQSATAACAFRSRCNTTPSSTTVTRKTAKLHRISPLPFTRYVYCILNILNAYLVGVMYFARYT